MSYQAFRKKGPSLQLSINKYSFGVQQNHIFSYDYERLIHLFPFFTKASWFEDCFCVLTFKLSFQTLPPYQTKYFLVSCSLTAIRYGFSVLFYHGMLTCYLLCNLHSLMSPNLRLFVLSSVQKAHFLKSNALFSFLGAFAKLRKATVGFVTSVRAFVRPSARDSSTTTSRIFMKFDIWAFFENLSRRFKFY